MTSPFRLKPLPALRRLHWQLARNVVLAAILTAVILYLLIALLVLIVFFASPLFPMAMQQETATRVAPRVALLWDDRSGMDRYLSDLSGGMAIRHKGISSSAPPPFYSFSVGLDARRGHRLLLLVTDATGKVRSAAMFRTTSVAPGTHFTALLSPMEQQICQRALRSNDPEALSGRLPDGSMAAAAPVRDAAGAVRGIVFIRLTVPFRPRTTLTDLAGYSGQIALMTCLATGIPAIIGGTIAARSLVRRLTPIRNAAEAWGRGDLTPSAPETPDDEVGQFGARLNAIRDDLEETLRLRHEIAAWEERHRIARDLHDTVKQEFFALCLHLAALQNAPLSEGTRNGLADAERIALRAQQELNNLIDELAPLPQVRKRDTNEGGSLVESLQRLTENWERQSRIPVRFQGEADVPGLSPDARLHLTRIVREALSNVARHSGATDVTITLMSLSDSWQLAIADSGNGLSSAIPQTGRGLRHLRERAEALPHGALRLENQATGGLKVTVTWKMG